MNLYPATAFIRHLLAARSAAGHGVHSPFVFDFLTTVVRGKSDPLIIREVESLRREMLADNRIVRVTDLGVGSAVHKGEERRISEIASTAVLPARYAMLLSRIAGSIAGVPPVLRSLASRRADRPNFSTRNILGRSHGAGGRAQGELRRKQSASAGRPGPAGPGIILELGTSLGISTLALALAAPERRVVSVEGCPALAEIARENLRRHGAANAEVLNMEFSEAISLLRKEGTRVSLAFIDGNHRGEALRHYVSEISTLGHEMIIVADDIHMNRDMYSTWCSIVNHALPLTAGRKIRSRAGKLLAPPGPATANTNSSDTPDSCASTTATATSSATPGSCASTTATATSSATPDSCASTTATATTNSSVTSTLETLRFGLIFRRRSLTPRHYRIRY